jgi:tetratricopeptide (TPR) repeat protein
MSENPPSIDLMEKMAHVDSKLEQLLAHQTRPKDEDPVETQPSPHEKYSEDILVADSEDERIHTAASFSERLKNPLPFKVAASLMNDVDNADQNLTISEDAAVAVKSLEGREVFFWIALVLGAFTLLILAADSGLSAWFFGDLVLWGAFIFLMRKFVDEGRDFFVAMIILLFALVLVPFQGEVRRWVLEIRQEVTGAFILASGPVEAATGDLKQATVDFVQKPFDMEHVWKPGTSVLAKAIQKNSRDRKYDHFFELALKHISKGEFDAARVYAHKAIYIDPSRPEAVNLLGESFEARKNRLEAEKYYRAALALNSSYKPAQRNLDRLTSRP